MTYNIQVPALQYLTFVHEYLDEMVSTGDRTNDSADTGEEIPDEIDEELAENKTENELGAHMQATQKTC